MSELSGDATLVLDNVVSSVNRAPLATRAVLVPADHKGAVLGIRMPVPWEELERLASSTPVDQTVCDDFADLEESTTVDVAYVGLLDEVALLAISSMEVDATPRTPDEIGKDAVE